MVFNTFFPSVQMSLFQRASWIIHLFVQMKGFVTDQTLTFSLQSQAAFHSLLIQYEIRIANMQLVALSSDCRSLSVGDCLGLPEMELVLSKASFVALCLIVVARMVLITT